MSDGRECSAGTALPRLEDFRLAVRTVFRLEAGESRSVVELTLTEVDETARRPGWESFSLLFHGADGAVPQGMYPVGHPDLGSFPLFIVPVAGNGAGRQYEAVLNRPAP